MVVSLHAPYAIACCKYHSLLFRGEDRETTAQTQSITKKPEQDAVGFPEFELYSKLLYEHISARANRCVVLPLGTESPRVGEKTAKKPASAHDTLLRGGVSGVPVVRGRCHPTWVRAVDEFELRAQSNGAEPRNAVLGTLSASPRRRCTTRCIR